MFFVLNIVSDIWLEGPQIVNGIIMIWVVFCSLAILWSSNHINCIICKSGQKQAAELAEKRALERELAKVSIKKEDVDLVSIL
jgi:hypothetical protein